MSCSARPFFLMLASARARGQSSGRLAPGGLLHIPFNAHQLGKPGQDRRLVPGPSQVVMNKDRDRPQFFVVAVNFFAPSREFVERCDSLAEVDKDFGGLYPHLRIG